MVPPNIQSIKRLFQLQIPQRFRPTIASVLAKTVGHVNLETPTVYLNAVAYWARFSNWCTSHPVRRWAEDKESLYEEVILQQNLESCSLTYLEFGVFRGDSLRWWVGRLSHAGTRFVGFDTFTGLPEYWRPTEPKGHFNAGGRIPDIRDPRCSFEVGLFQDTLTQFVSSRDLSGPLVINLDADMFTSTLFVLATLSRYLKPGDLLFFDEFSCPLDEFRAFESFIRCFRVKYEVAGATKGYTRVCIKIL